MKAHADRAAAPLLEGLPPILPTGPVRALVLGSFPSVKSLESGQFYGNPQNWFWRVLAHCRVIEDSAAPYPERIAALRRNGLAVWDLYARVRRPGSGDDRISDAVPNRVGTLLTGRGPFPILLNGRRAPRMAAPLRRSGCRHGRAAVDQPAAAALEHARITCAGARRMVCRAWRRGDSVPLRRSCTYRGAMRHGRQCFDQCSSHCTWPTRTLLQTLCLKPAAENPAAWRSTTPSLSPPNADGLACASLTK